MSTVIADRRVRVLGVRIVRLFSVAVEYSSPSTDRERFNTIKCMRSAVGYILSVSRFHWSEFRLIDVLGARVAPATNELITVGYMRVRIVISADFSRLFFFLPRAKDELSPLPSLPFRYPHFPHPLKVGPLNTAIERLGSATSSGGSRFC